MEEGRQNFLNFGLKHSLKALKGWFLVAGFEFGFCRRKW